MKTRDEPYAGAHHVYGDHCLNVRGMIVTTQTVTLQMSESLALFSLPLSPLGDVLFPWEVTAAADF